MIASTWAYSIVRLFAISYRSNIYGKILSGDFDINWKHSESSSHQAIDNKVNSLKDQGQIVVSLHRQEELVSPHFLDKDQKPAPIQGLSVTAMKVYIIGPCCRGGRSAGATPDPRRPPAPRLKCGTRTSRAWSGT